MAQFLNNFSFLSLKNNNIIFPTLKCYFLKPKVLSGSPSDVKPAIADDDSKSKTKSKAASLYQVSSDSGTLEVTNVGTSPFKQSSLDSGDCFIVDTGSGQTIFVWKGVFKIELFIGYF